LLDGGIFTSVDVMTEFDLGSFDVLVFGGNDVLELFHELVDGLGLCAGELGSKVVGELVFAGLSRGDGIDSVWGRGCKVQGGNGESVSRVKGVSSVLVSVPDEDPGESFRVDGFRTNGDSLSGQQGNNTDLGVVSFGDSDGDSDFDCCGVSRG
jgi:hypothetical protein